MPPARTLRRSSLRSFLGLAKSTLESAIKGSTPITFVLGNESADLDSLCSTVVFAYLRTYSPLSHPQTIHVPLSNLPRADLKLRPELRPVLSRANIEPNDLITLSDLPPSSQRLRVLRPENTRWILIDHNAMRGELGSIYNNHVTGTIDHHDDEGAVPEYCDGEPRIIHKSGSCASLVVGYCEEAWDALSRTATYRDRQSHAEEEEEDSAEGWDAEVALLALAPILIDTRSLRDAAKVTPSDVDAVRYLESRVKLGAAAMEVGAERVTEAHGHGHGYDRDAYLREISEAKESIEGLSLEDILRKDYKQWTEHGSVTLGISVVVKNIDFLVRKAGGQAVFLERLRLFAGGRQLSVVAIMTTSTSAEGKFMRELLVWGVDERGSEVAKRFESGARDLLGLVEEWGKGALDEVSESPESGWRRCWVQERVENSRKQVAPLLRKAVV